MSEFLDRWWMGLGLLGSVLVAVVAVHYTPARHELPCSAFAERDRDSVPARCFRDFVGSDGGTP